MVELEKNNDLTEIIKFFISRSEETSQMDLLSEAYSLSMKTDLKSKRESLILSKTVALEVFQVAEENTCLK